MTKAELKEKIEYYIDQYQRGNYSDEECYKLLVEIRNNFNFDE